MERAGTRERNADNPVVRGTGRFAPPGEPGARPESRFAGLASRLFEPVDIASVVFFRVAFGVVMFWEVCRYFLLGWVGTYYAAPALDFRFAYYGFGWLQPLPGDWAYVHFAALGVLALFVAFGFLYRASAALFFVGFTYVFLLDQTAYLNHFYLISLVSLLLVFVPAHRSYSIDAALRPGLRSRTIPAWALFLLAAQVGIAYFYGGIAKLNADWLRGEPMGLWLPENTDFPLIGEMFTERWMALTFSYGGLLFDLAIVPLLLWRRTRIFAFVAAFAFHYTNAQLFSIGIFPMLMVAATTLFLSPSWPRRVFGWIPRRGRRAQEPAPGRAGGVPYRTRPAILALVGLYLAVQLLVPLRHHLYLGNVSWTEEGHRFSWHMKLRDKQAQATFFAVDPQTNERSPVEPADYMSAEQAAAMAGDPDMLLQFAHHAADDLGRGEGGENVEIRADVRASLNGRQPQRLIDPGVDLASQPRNPASADWILPLNTPLHEGGAR